ncbi:MAG: S1 RNA-binding domain-containing protein [Chloroflexi bacterium]|nr:S1 RNA-binding domain-containing protein [Chloroflexota bacterium]
MDGFKSDALEVGQQVTGEVYRIYTDRALLHLPGKVHGILRRREISWEDESPDLAKILHEGHSLTAVIIKVEPEYRSVELSLRYLENDPWQAFAAKHPPLTDVYGVVKSVREFGAFVSLEKGVEGFIPTGEISLEAHLNSAQGALWIGDTVAARIQEIDPAHHRLRLSMRDTLKARGAAHSQAAQASEASLEETLDAATRYRLRQLLGDVPGEFPWPEPGRIRRVLVADNDAGFRASLGQLLQEWGYGVSLAGDTQTAQELAAQRRHDLAILDHLFSQERTSEFAAALRQSNPDIEVLILSGVETDERGLADAQAQGYTLEYKPFGPEALADYLAALEREEGSAPAKSAAAASAETVEARQAYGLADMESLLLQLARQSGADGAALFRESASRPGDIEVAASAGVTVKEDDEIRATLRLSPVGDVLRSRGSLLIYNVHDNPGQSRYLKPAVSFASCLGAAVEIPEQERPYALFLFSNQAAKFNEDSRAWLEGQGARVGNLVFRQVVFSILLGSQKELLRSQLRAGALHDVRNAIGGMQFHLARLADRGKELAEAAPHSEAAASVRAITAEVQSVANQMSSTLALFRELTYSEKPEALDVNALIRRIVERQSPLARDMMVTLRFQPDHGLPVVLLNGLHLQHAVDNVVLNAIQWSAGRRLRLVTVSTSYAAESALPLQIRVEDSGPGIHAQLQKAWIFELGNSLRENGSGLGLYIARALVASMQGRIGVETSLMESGSVFLIELPALVKGQ